VSERRCDKCEWFQPAEVQSLSEVGYCRVRPPGISEAGATAINARLYLSGRADRLPANLGVWPIVSSDDWCGSFSLQAQGNGDTDRE
jgi:hypothetical protein